MEAYQIDTAGVIVGPEEEPVGPSPNRIKDILHRALNRNGYTFSWEAQLPGQSKEKPLHGVLSDGDVAIDLLIYAWRISNEGNSRVNLHGKRIQIGSCDDNGFHRPITDTEKTLLLGIYERDEGHPLIAAWDVVNNRGHGSSKSCFVKLSDFAGAIANGIFKSADSAGNPVYAMSVEYLTAYVEQVQADATLKVVGTTPPSPDPPTFSRQVRQTSQKRAADRIQTILNRISGITETEKQAVVNQRVGQGDFKGLLVEKYDGKCCVCGLDFPQLLIGSHIKSWSKSNDQEKLDGNNGLLLCVTHDALFDRFLISFADDGQIVISNLLSPTLLKLLNVKSSMRITITEEMKPYLRWHREQLKRG